MTISLQNLRNANNRWHQTVVAKSLREAVSQRQTTAFLCHSHRDDDLAKGLQVLLREHGCSLYIDWQDTSMPETPDRVTAHKIQRKIIELDLFLFLATPNSTSSRWCPWEIGYADGMKPLDKILVIPTTDNSGRYYGNEYLQLYRRIVIADDGKPAAFNAGQTTGGVYAKSL